MKKSLEEIIFNIVALTVTTLFALACLLPIWLTVSGSFTSERAIYQGLRLIPAELSLEAYKLILKTPGDMINAYKVTIIIVAVGTALGLILTSMTAYVLYRKDFKYRNGFAFFYFFTTLFSGGLVPSYILTCTLGLRNTYTVLIISGVFSVFNMIVMRTYFTGNIPQALVESAKIDGADDFRIYASIIMPSAGPILATIGLLLALAYWNNWNTAMLYIDEKSLYPLQYYLYRIFQSVQMSIIMREAGIATQQLPQEGYKLAMTVFTMGPVILFYPFVQKYFVAGVTIGAVKG